MKKNGEEFEFDVKITEILWENKLHNMVILRDISERKKQEKELEKHRNHLEQLVKERTDELEASNEELKTTNDELYEQRDELEQTIRKLNETQSQLVQSEKMASLGVLVAGVAHEINNPINFINSSINGLKNNLNYLLGFTDLYQQLSEDNIEVIKEISRKQKDASLSEVLEMFKRSIEIIEVGIERTTKIVKSLKSFARSDEKELSGYDVNENIDNTLLILYHQYKNRIEIIKEYEQLPLVVCYPGQINQVIMNILTNAIQAIHEKGFITITTKAIANDSVSVSIEDTGTGINEKDINHIFDPFYTTKEVGKGTGLGLSISYSIIKEHKGTIKVKSKVGKGSCFTVIIPIKREITI
ncbi:MAG: GHKL domain-containing protein [Chloroflexia bacterium]|nr:GHKL domain-containing protein [Chloroflexia bacterium]